MRSAATILRKNSESQSVTQQYGWFIAFSLPVLLQLWMVYRFTVNVPYIDDYTFLVDVMYRQSNDLVLGHLFDELFHPHGEHIILFGRLAALTDLWIEGELNFRTLFFVGNATVIGTVWLLYRVARRGGLSPWQFLPVVLLFFQPQYYDNSLTWAICTLQHLPALFFAFCAFELISRPSQWAFALSLPFAFLALFSNGNGLAVPVCGFLLLLVLGRFRRLILWTIFSIAVAGLYLYVHHIYHSPATGSNLLHPIRVVAGFFMLTGSFGSVVNHSSVILSLVGIGLLAFTGVIILTGLAYHTGFGDSFSYLPKRVRQWINTLSSRLSNASSPVLMACYLYALITLFGVAFARSLGWYQGLMASRFIYFATVALVLGYLLLLLWLKPVYRASVSRISIAIGLIFSILSYCFTFAEAMNVRQSQRSDLHNWRENGLLITLPAGDVLYDHYYSKLLRAAVKQGVYHLPVSIIEPALRTIRTAPVTPDLIKKDSSFVYGPRQIHYLSLGNRLPLAYAFDTEEAYLLLQSNRHTFMWPVNRSPTKLMLYMITGRTDWDANTVWIFADQLPHAQYKPSLAVLADGHWTTVRSDQTITIGTKSAN